MFYSRYKVILNNEIQNLQDIVEGDQAVLAVGTYSGRQPLRKLLEQLYIRYVQSANKLSEASDQLREPGDCSLARRLWDVAATRALQIAQELTRLTAEMSHPRLLTLIPLNLTPRDTQLTIPPHFLIEREEEISQRQQLFEEASKEEIGRIEDEEEEEEDDQESRNLFLLLEPHEPVRKVSEETVHSNEETEQRESIDYFGGARITDQRKDKQEEIANNKRNAAFIIFQLKRYALRIDRRKVLGMQPDQDPTVFEIEKVGEKRNRAARRDRENVLEVTRAQVSETVKKRFADSLDEDIEDELRAWYEDWLKNTREYPSLPPATPVPLLGRTLGIPKKLPAKWVDENFSPPQYLPKNPILQQLVGVENLGGSALITNGYWLQPDDYLKCEAALLELRKQKKEKEDKTKSKTGKKDKKDTKKTNELEFVMKPTDVFAVFHKVHEDLTFRKAYDNKQVKNILYEDPMEDTVMKFKKDVMADLRLDARKIVDEKIGKELVDLDRVYRKEHGKKAKKKPKEKKNKKKGKKGKGPKDLPDADEKFVDLIRQGVVREYGDTKLTDYIDWDTDPQIADLLLRLCVLPLVSSTIHLLVPLTRSLCLVGPSGTAKRFLVDAIVSEVGATLFDLTPCHIGAAFPGPDQLKKLLTSLPTLLRMFQPSVVLVEDAEKIFYKKVPKNERELNPRRFKGLLTKIVKGITVQDRVLVIGTSNAPWLAKKTFNKFFNTIIPVRIPDYGVYSKIWQTELDKQAAPLEAAPFAKVTDRLTTKVSTIQQLVLQTQSRSSDVATHGILKALAADTDTLNSTDKKLLPFLKKLPLAKAKVKIEQLELEAAKKTKKPKH